MIHEPNEMNNFYLYLQKKCLQQKILDYETTLKDLTHKARAKDELAEEVEEKDKVIFHRYKCPIYTMLSNLICNSCVLL